MITFSGDILLFCILCAKRLGIIKRSQKTHPSTIVCLIQTELFTLPFCLIICYFTIIQVHIVYMIIISCIILEEKNQVHTIYLVFIRISNLCNFHRIVDTCRCMCRYSLCTMLIFGMSCFSFVVCVYKIFLDSIINLDIIFANISKTVFYYFFLISNENQIALKNVAPHVPNSTSQKTDQIGTFKRLPCKKQCSNCSQNK